MATTKKTAPKDTQTATKKKSKATPKTFDPNAKYDTLPLIGIIPADKNAPETEATTPKPPKKHEYQCAKTHLIELYPDDPTFEAAYRWLRSQPDWVAILHDKDILEDGTPKKAHIHAILRGNEKRTIGMIATLSGWHSNLIQTCNNERGSLEYLLHINNPEKTPYQLHEVNGSNGSLHNRLRTLVKRGNDEADGIIVLLDFIENSEVVFFREVLTYALNNGLYAEYRRAYAMLRDIIKEHNEIKQLTARYE